MYNTARTYLISFCLPVRRLLMPFLLVLTTPTWAATTLYVSPTGNDNNEGTATSPYRTIQAAFNNAGSGDTVTLDDGTYTGNGNRDLDFSGKNLTVTSRNGADKTVIDCGSTPEVNHRAFYLHTKEHGTFSALTIKNASAAVSIADECTADLTNCTFANNADGVYNMGAVTLTDCTLSNNRDRGVYSPINATLARCTITGSSTGIYTTGQGKLTDCTIAGNTEIGILTDGTATLINCTIKDNKKVGLVNGDAQIGKVELTKCIITGNLWSGVVNGQGGMATLTKCTISNNVSAKEGGALYNDGRMILADCILANNRAAAGGALYNRHVAVLTNCVLTGNTAAFKITANGEYNANGTRGGGGICNEGTLTLRFCSVCGNTAQGPDAQGGGLENCSMATLTNCILWNNSDLNIVTAPRRNDLNPAATPRSTTATYCDIEGGLNGVGNMKIDPMFLDQASGDLHLKAGSPCIGKGSAINGSAGDPRIRQRQVDAIDTALNTPVTTDLASTQRPNPPTIGALEFDGTKTH